MSDTEQKEDTTTPAAAEQKITKPKAPGRVAAGKKLAELNKKNKAKKDPSSESSDGWDINPGYVIGGFGLLVAMGSLYLQWKSQKTAVHLEPVIHQPKEKKRPKIPEME